MPIPQCVIDKIPLDNVSTNVFRCPICKREYIMDYEIMNFGDDVGTAFDDEAATIELEGIAAMSKPIIMTEPTNKENEYSNNVMEQERVASGKKSDIPIPKYLIDSDTKKVVEYHEG